MPEPSDICSADHWPAGRILVVAATYNEHENIATLIHRVLAVDPAFQLLVVDDDSPDGTGQMALELATRHPRLHVLVRRGRRGLGGAILEGFRLARSRGFTVAINMDADFSHDPDDIPRLLAALEPIGGKPADLVIGSRRGPGGRVEGWPLSRQIASRLVSWFTRWALRVPVRDASSGFRAIRVDVLDQLPADLSQGYAFFEHLLWGVHRSGGRIVEVPITFTERLRGRSKADLRAIVRGVADLLRLARATWLGP